MLLKISEDIGVSTIKDFYLQLKEMLTKEQEVILDFQKVKRVDLSLAQVIMAANRESVNKGKKLLLKSVSEDIKRQFFIAGFAK
jgi:anti-anti-sigma regulatory factor